MVRITQCLCPMRHAIMAVAYQPDAVPTALAGMEATQAAGEAMLRKAVEQVLAAGALNPWCGLCGSRDWHYEDRATKFRTLDEARSELARLEAQNAAARAALQNPN